MNSLDIFRKVDTKKKAGRQSPTTHPKDVHHGKHSPSQTKLELFSEVSLSRFSSWTAPGISVPQPWWILLLTGIMKQGVVALYGNLGPPLSERLIQDERAVGSI